MTATALTPTDAFDALRQRALERGLKTDAAALGYEGYAARFQYDGAVADQSVAYPHNRCAVNAILTVIAVTDGRLVLRLVTSWRSIYGRHASLAEYVTTKTESGVSIAAGWQQIVPTSTLDHIDIHTGGVDVDDYHADSLTVLRGRQAIGRMLSDGSERAVRENELADIADIVLDSIPLL